MATVTKRSWSFPGFSPRVYDFKDKAENVKNYVLYMLNRTQSMFRYSGLPDSIPARSLELLLQSVGHVGICRVNGELYALTGGLGGEPDAYYMPTVYTVANPALKYDANLEIGKDVIVIPNDSCYMGLMPLMERYASAMAENDLTFRVMNINSRITSLISSADDRATAGAKKYIDDIEKGELGVIAESAFLEGIKAQPYSTTGGTRFTDLIEYQQYLKASWLNELGIDASFNMKREALNSAESALNQDALFPLIDDMLKQREEGLKAVNELFGTEISVELNSIWEDNQQEIELELNPEETTETNAPDETDEKEESNDEPETDKTEERDT